MFSNNCIVLFLVRQKPNPKKKQKGVSKNKRGPKYDFRKGYWGAATDILSDQEFRVMVMWIQRLSEPLCIEYSCIASACLRKDPGFWIARSTGKPLIKIIQEFSFAVHKSIILDIFPTTPNFSLGERAVGVEKIHGESDPIGQNWGLEYLKNKSSSELKGLISMALTLIQNKLKSGITFGIRTLAGILSNRKDIAKESIEKVLFQWQTIISVERYGQASEVEKFLEFTKGFRKSASLRLVCLVLEQEYKIFLKEKIDLNLQSALPMTFEIIKCLFGKGCLNTKIVEDSFCKIARYYSTCRGATGRSSANKILYCIIASLTSFSLLQEELEEIKRKKLIYKKQTNSKNKRRINLQKTNFEIAEENEAFAEQHFKKDGIEIDKFCSLKESFPFPEITKNSANNCVSLMKELSKMFLCYDKNSTFTLHPCELDSNDFSCWRSNAAKFEKNASGTGFCDDSEIFVDPSAQRTYNVYCEQNPFSCNSNIIKESVPIKKLNQKIKTFKTLSTEHNFEVITGLTCWGYAIKRLENQKVFDPICQIEKTKKGDNENTCSTLNYRKYLVRQFEQIAILGGDRLVGPGTIFEERFPSNHPQYNPVHGDNPKRFNHFWLVVASAKYGAYGLRLKVIEGDGIPYECRLLKKKNPNLKFLLFAVPDSRCIKPINSQMKYIIAHEPKPISTAIGLFFVVDQGVPLLKNLLQLGVCNDILRRLLVSRGFGIPERGTSAFSMVEKLWTFHGAELERIRDKYKTPIKIQDQKKMFDMQESQTILPFMDEHFIETVCFDWNGLEKREWGETTDKIIKQQRTHSLIRLNPDELIQNVYVYNSCKTHTITSIVIDKNATIPRTQKYFPYGKYMTEQEARALAFHWKESFIEAQKNKILRMKTSFHGRKNTRLNRSVKKVQKDPIQILRRSLNPQTRRSNLNKTTKTDPRKPNEAKALIPRFKNK